MSSVFRGKKVSEFSFMKVSRKFLTDKESLPRIKHLRYIIENVSEKELKDFFVKHYSLIFHASYDMFVNVQMDLQQKNNSTHFKEFQYILVVFEKILILVPDLINKRWQYNCIMNIIKSLLQSNNLLKIRSQGMQLFILWFQILGTNAPRSCYDIYISLIPIFEPIIKSNIYKIMESSIIFFSEKISEMELKPMLIHCMDKDAGDNDTNQYLLKFILRYMVTEGVKVEWNLKKDENQLKSYNFIFDQFKEYFLPVIFIKCSSDYTIEQNMSESLATMEFLDGYSPVRNNYPIDGIKIFQYQTEIIHWLEEIIPTDNMNVRHIESIDQEKRDTLSNSFNESNSPFPSDIVWLKFDRVNINGGHAALKKIHQIIFENEENFNIVNQLCKHALYLPLQFYKTHLSVISIYKYWLYNNGTKPLQFMIDLNSSSPVVMRRFSNNNDTATEINQMLKISQNMQRVIFTNVGSVFLHTYRAFKNQTSYSIKKLDTNTNKVHCDIVKITMSEIYHKAIYNISNLDYDHLMNVLLDISVTVLTSISPKNRPENHWISDDSSIRQLFHLLNALLIKSSLNFCVSEEIWNRYSQLYSSFLEWHHILTEWKVTVQWIVKMMGNTLYNVNMDDLPLEKKIRRSRLISSLKHSDSSKDCKRQSKSDDHSITTRSLMNPNKSNTMTPTTSVRNTLRTEFDLSFTDKLKQNSEEIVFFLDNPEKCDIENSNQNIAKNRIKFDDLNENFTVSYDTSSLEENSSYVSAEYSSSPHSFRSALDHFPASLSSSRNMFLDINKKLEYPERNIGFLSEVRFLLTDEEKRTEMSSSVCIKHSIEAENEDNADDEDENEINNNTHAFNDRIKHSTIIRSDSVSGISSQFQKMDCQNFLHDSTKTNIKCNVRKKSYQRKNEDDNLLNLNDNIVKDNITEMDFLHDVHSYGLLIFPQPILSKVLLVKNQEFLTLLWKRFIGLLGNVTKVTNLKILSNIFTFLSNITDYLIKMRENMCISGGNEITPKPPICVPPIDHIIPWMFEVFNLGTMYDDVKTQALRVVCKITVRKMDIQPSTNHLVLFYSLIHSIIYSENLILICTLIENLGGNLFSMPLPGLEIVILDIIKACEFILEKSHLKSIDDKNYEFPKLVAISLLGSLLVFKDYCNIIKTFDPKSKAVRIIDCSSYKNKIFMLLTSTIKNELTVSHRALCIICIALYCNCQIINFEVSSNDISDLRQSILLLLRMILINNYEIATISSEMIKCFVTCFSQVQDKLSHIPEQIIQVLSFAISNSIILHKTFSNFGFKKYVSTMIFTLVDWCMFLPLTQFLESDDLHPRGLVHLVFSALENVLTLDEFSNSEGSLSTSKLNENMQEKKQNVELRISFELISSQLMDKDKYIQDIFNNPLLECISHFEVRETEESTSSKIPNISINNSEAIDQIKLSAKTALCHLINHIGQFPMNNILGCINSCVQEHHDFQIDKGKQISENLMENFQSDESSSDVFNSPDLQMFVVNDSMIVSLLSKFSKVRCKTTYNNNQTSAPEGPSIIRHVKDQEKDDAIRIIIRDISGKYCWDVNVINKCDPNVEIINANCNKHMELLHPSPPPRRTLSTYVSEKCLLKNSLTTENISNDPVDSLLGCLFSSSPEIFSSNVKSRKSTFHSISGLESVVRQIQDQSTDESNYHCDHCFKVSHDKFIDNKIKANITIEHPPDKTESNSKFYYCRQILNQLGFLSLKHRTSIDCIFKNNIYRDLKCIDSLKSRETHKIAVLYVAWGQEDKVSILENDHASLEFNNFIDGLGWAVDLQTHKGFMGGLDSNGQNGKYAPYYANSTLEIMFHVSTWMRSSLIEVKTDKFVHLGNDEVMVIWSENYRNFRSNITKTEFGDVMIIIYPLRNGLFSINIESKGELRLFGPLFDGAIVGERELPCLVRMTAINASRSIRESKPHYEEYYVGRAKYIQKAIKKFINPMTFETFSMNMYSPPDNQSDYAVSDAIHENVNQDSVKYATFKTCDLPYNSTLSEKDMYRSGTTPITYRKCGEDNDFGVHRKLSKVTRHS